MASSGGNGEGAKGEITHLLVAWSEGDLEALGKVFPLAFEDLRRIARRCCGKIPSKDLQPTELIGEIYFVLLKQRNVSWESRGQFYRFAAFLMERVLLGSRRVLKTEKRGGGIPHVPLIEALGLAAGGDSAPGADGSAASVVRSPGQEEVLDALAVGVDVTEKIGELGKLDPQLAEVARLRYLIGLSIEETAETLGVSITTVNRKWRHAKRFLARMLDGYTVD